MQSPKQGTPSAASARCPRAAINPGEKLPEALGNPPGAASPWPWTVPLFRQVKPSKAALRGHFDPNFPDFNTDYPDQLRADEFLREFDGFAKARGKGASGTGTAKELPQFVLLYLPDDHTGGTRPGKPTPQASVADNDLAVGRVVDAVSHSPYWDDTAIFVVEDDAQNGADHVDAHRSIALVISKYAPHTAGGAPFVDSRFYSTVSVVRTMETLLGLPPMNNNDALCSLISTLFTGPGDQASYAADVSNRENGLIYTANAKTAPGAKESSKMDFQHADHADAQKLNVILWKDAMGDKPVPAMIKERRKKSAQGDDD